MVTKLCQELWELEDELREAKNARDKEKRALMRAYEEEVNRSLELIHGEKIVRLQQQVTDATQAELEERERLAVDKAPYPIGTRMVEWRDYAGSWSPKRNMKPTGRVGLVELVTRSTTHPTNRSRAEVGTYVVRLLKKDGSVSLNYVDGYRVFGSHPRWYPEGTTPKS